MYTVLYLPAGTFDPVLDPQSPHIAIMARVIICYVERKGFDLTLVLLES